MVFIYFHVLSYISSCLEFSLNRFFVMTCLSNFCNCLLLFLRHSGEDNKMLVCDTCDKGYHTFCLQPVMDAVPTNGWKCKVS